MRTLSAQELIKLGEEVSVTVDEAEADILAEQVNEMLDSLDKIAEVPVYERAGGDTARTWSDPESNPYNALVVECNVPPTPDNTGVLSGTTVGLKDIISVAGVPMQCNSAVMNGFVPGTDATVVQRLRQAGATITVKTNLDEFAGSARGKTGRSVPIQNPHDPDRTAGGSSGGSAVAVSDGLVDVALGSDTGGSIRIPASFCGVVGMKPTYGLVPLLGVVENTYTQDHVGPITASVDESADVLDVIAGCDERDPSTLQAAGREGYRVGGYATRVENRPPLESISVGVLENGFGDGVTPPVEEQTRSAIDRIEDAGATVESVSIKYFEYGPAIKNALSFTELAAHWRDGAAPYRRGGFVDEGYQSGFAARSRSESGQLDQFYKSKLLAGAQIIVNHSGRPYTRAQAAREVLREEFVDVFTDVDIVLMPTMPDTAPLLDEVADPGFDYARNTRIANVTRMPAITIPNGTLEELPVGLQLMSDAFEDDHLLAAAASIEEVLE